MDQLITSGSLKCVDILSHVQPGADTLRPLIDLVQIFINGGLTTTPHLLVVFDGISVLEWLGFNTKEICRLSRALSSLCRQVLCEQLSLLGTDELDAAIYSHPFPFSSGTTSWTAK